MSEPQTFPDWLPAEVRESIAAKFPGKELHAVQTQEGAVILRLPTGTIVDRRVAAVDKHGARAAAERFVLDCACYPDEATLRQYFETRAHMAMWLASKLDGYAVGATEEDEVKL